MCKQLMVCRCRAAKQYSSEKSRGVCGLAGRGFLPVCLPSGAESIQVPACGVWLRFLFMPMATKSMGLTSELLGRKKARPHLKSPWQLRVELLGFFFCCCCIGWSHHASLYLTFLLLAAGGVWSLFHSSIVGFSRLPCRSSCSVWSSFSGPREACFSALAVDI